MEDQKDILEEIKLMKRIAQHKHIVSILGCITLSHPVCLIVEFCEHGDLLQYLRNSRPAVRIFVLYIYCWFGVVCVVLVL